MSSIRFGFLAWSSSLVLLLFGRRLGPIHGARIQMDTVASNLQWGLNRTDTPKDTGLHLSSDFFSWRVPMTDATGDEQSCTCNGEVCTTIGASDMALHFGEACFELVMPIAPAVSVRIAVRGEYDWSGSMSAPGFRGVTLEVSGALVVRLAPLSVHLKIAGSLTIESEWARSSSQLVLAGLRGLVGSWLKNDAPTEVKAPDLITSIKTYDPSFNAEDPWKSAQWMLAMAERVNVLRALIGSRLQKLYTDRAEKLQGDIMSFEYVRRDNEEAVADWNKQQKLTYMPSMAKKYWFRAPHDDWPESLGGTEMDMAMTQLTALLRTRAYEKTLLAHAVAGHVAKTLFGEGEGTDRLLAGLDGAVDNLQACEALDAVARVELPKDYDWAAYLVEDREELQRRGVTMRVLDRAEGVNKVPTHARTHGRLMCALLLSSPDILNHGYAYELDKLEAYAWEEPGGEGRALPFAVLVMLPQMFHMLRMEQMEALAELAALKIQKPTSLRAVYAQIDAAKLKLSQMVADMQTLTDMAPRDLSVSCNGPVCTTMVSYVEQQTSRLLSTDWEHSECQAGPDFELVACVKNGVSGWLLDMGSQENVERQLQESRERMAKELQAASTEFTWQLQGTLSLGVAFGLKLNAFNLCDPDESEVSVGVSALRTQQFKMNQQDYVVRPSSMKFARIWTASFFPYWRLGYKLATSWGKSGGAGTRRQRRDGIALRFDGSIHRVEITLAKVKGGKLSVAGILTMANSILDPLMNALAKFPVKHLPFYKLTNATEVNNEIRYAENKPQAFKKRVKDTLGLLMKTVKGVEETFRRNPQLAAMIASEGTWSGLKHGTKMYHAKVRLLLTIRAPNDGPISIASALKLSTDLTITEASSAWANSLMPVLPQMVLMLTKGTVIDLSGMYLLQRCKQESVTVDDLSLD